jgi:hypothetical protein
MNGEEAPKKKKTWLWIVLGVLVFFGMIAVGGIIVAVSFFRQNVDITRQVSAGAASPEFDAIYAKFPGQQPLIQLVDGQPQLVPERASHAPASTPLSTLHMLAYSSDEENLARITIPFWLLRMKEGPIRLSAYSQGWDDRGVSFRVRDIEQHGPGIVVDVKRNEGRMLVWAE